MKSMLIGALIVAVGVLGYLYWDSQHNTIFKAPGVAGFRCSACDRHQRPSERASRNSLEQQLGCSLAAGKQFPHSVEPTNVVLSYFARVKVRSFCRFRHGKDHHAACESRNQAQNSKGCAISTPNNHRTGGDVA